MRSFRFDVMRIVAVYGTMLLAFFAACSSTSATRSYILGERMSAPAGASMLVWTTSQGVTKEFVFVGHEGPVVKLLYREFRKGEPKDLQQRDLVFAVAENYTAGSELHAITLVIYEGFEMRILELPGQSIVYEVTKD